MNICSFINLTRLLFGMTLLLMCLSQAAQIVLLYYTIDIDIAIGPQLISRELLPIITSLTMISMACISSCMSQIQHERCYATVDKKLKSRYKNLLGSDV